MNHILKKFNINTSDLTYLDPRKLSLRSKLEIFINHDNTILYIHVSRKSRILQKDVDTFEKVVTNIENKTNTSIQYKNIAIDSLLCSKAKTKFETNGWKVFTL